MKPYPSYKDSGIEWLGEIPEHWELTKIKYSSYVKGRVGWKGLKSDEFLTEGYSFLVTGTDFKNGTINWENTYYIDQERYDDDPFIQLKEDDLLITKDGTIGKISIVKDLNGKATLNSGIFLVRPINNFYKTKFLYWILLSDVFRSFINFHKTGSTISHLYQNVFEEFIYPEISIENQTQIAAFLDLKTKQIDNLIAKKEKLIELLKEERTAIINQAVTKGLPTEARAKAGLDPHVPMKDSGIAWLGEIPEHWEVKPLKYVAHIVLGKMVTPNDKGGYVKKPYLRAQNIQWFNVDDRDIKEMWFSKQELSIYKISEFDLLVSEGGEVGRTAIWKNELTECYIQNSVHKLTLFSNNNPYYFLNQFYIYGYYGQFESIVSKVSIAHLTREKLKEIKIIIPPIDEQTLIVQYIDKKTQRIDRSIEKISNEVNLIKEYKTSLINEAVTGKIDVREYKPEESMEI